MLEMAAVGIGLLAMTAWASAALHAILLVPHRHDDQSLLGLALGGHRFFSRDTWKPSGHALHSRFLASALAFFGLIVLAMLLGAVTAATAV